jgi:hypothetical protein
MAAFLEYVEPRRYNAAPVEPLTTDRPDAS